VNNAIKGLLDGSVAPEDIKIEGLETEEEKLQKQVWLFIVLDCY